MRASIHESTACAVFANAQRDRIRARKRLERLAEAQPERVRKFLASQPLAEVRNNPAMMRLSRIVGA